MRIQIVYLEFKISSTTIKSTPTSGRQQQLILLVLVYHVFLRLLEFWVTKFAICMSAIRYSIFVPLVYYIVS